MADATFLETGGNTEISQYEFTWTVQGTGHTYGLFANGDAWIVGPVTITDIQPASVNDAGWIKHGTMLNPAAAEQAPNGFDNSMDYNGYQSALNVSPNITGSNLVVTSGSLVSSQSQPTPDNRPQLFAAAVLTVLTVAPPANSFRPPYQGADKTIQGNLADLNYTILQTQNIPASAPDLTSITNAFERPWIEINTLWNGRYMHPSQNQPDYGRDIARLLGRGLQSLHLNYTNPQKELLYVRLVQFGIDVYGAARDQGLWADLGGHNHGRKLPLILAAQALDNAAIRAYADAAVEFIFQEDRQTFYVSQADVDLPRYTADGRPRDPYTTAMIGTPEWGEQHTRQPNRDGSNWDAFYRDIVGSSLIGNVLAAKLLNVRALWNHDELYDYMDRWYDIEKDNVGTGPSDLQQFEADMWAQNLTVAPITLSNPAESSIEATTATVSVSTDTLTGILYYYVSQSSVAPSAADLIAGTGAVAAGNVTTPTSPQSFPITGLTPGTQYFTYFYQTNGGDTSVILSSGIWQTASGPAVPGHVASMVINASQVVETLTGYRGYFDMADLPTPVHDLLTADAGDLRLRLDDGTTEIPREIEVYDPVGDTGICWYLIPGSLSDTVNTTIQIWADGTSTEPLPTDPIGRNAVWVSDAVQQHYQGGPTDSTGNNTFTLAGTGGAPDYTQAGSVLITGQFLEATSMSGLSIATGYTIRYDASFDASQNQFGGLIEGNEPSDSLRINRENSNTVMLQRHFDGTTANQVTTSIGNQIWGQGRLVLDWSWDGVNMTVYKNGTQIDQFAQATVPDFNNLDPLTVYGLIDASLNPRPITGRMYNFALTNRAHSAGYIQTEQNNRTTSSFYTIFQVAPTAITLTNPTEADITQTTATVGCTTDTTLGTLYAYVGVSATPPTAEDIKNGTGSVWFDNQLNPTLTQTFSVTGLLADRNYYTYFYQENGGDTSNILASGVWRTLQDNLVLSNASEVDITSTSATIGCQVSEIAGTLWAYVSQSATPPSIADLKTGLGSDFWGEQTPPATPTIFNASGLTPSTNYYSHFYQEDGARTSNVLSSTVWTTLAATVPILSNPTETNIGQSSATIGCTTDTLGGVLYVYTSTSAIAPSIADLKAGTGATFADNVVPAVPVNNFNATGLDPDKTYYNYFYQEAAANSAILESGPWNTLAGLIPTSIDGAEVQEALFRTAGNSNLLMVGNVQVWGANVVEAEVNGITATLTWNVTQYEGDGIAIANYLATQVETSVTVRFSAV